MRRTLQRSRALSCTEIHDNALSRGDWFPRVYFGGEPARVQLTLNADATQSEISIAVAAGCAAYSSHYAFHGHSDSTFGRAVARAFSLSALGDSITAKIASALWSDAAIRSNAEAKIDPTPLCAMFGQGHQSFLDRLRSVSQGTVPRALQGKRAPDLNSETYIERALFAPWTRSDATESFRWDFHEDRRYALRAVDPSSDAPTTEHGANRLAALGLLSFQSAPVVDARRGVVGLATRGVSRGKNRRPRITWPIWTQPAGLETIHSMLDEPELSEDKPSFEILRPNGIHFAQRVTRIMSGKFINFSRAEALV